MSGMKNINEYEISEEPSNGELREIEKELEESEKEPLKEEDSADEEDYQEEPDEIADVYRDGSNLGDNSDDEAVEFDDEPNAYENNDEEEEDATGDNSHFKFDEIKLLMKEYRKYLNTRLSREEEVEYAKRMKQGDSDAREALIYYTVWVAIAQAKKLKYKGLRLEDKISAGLTGLVKAVDKFDYEKGYRFSTYATFYIKKEIMRAGWEVGSTIRIPEATALDINRMKKAANYLESIYCRKPDIDEIAKYLGIASSKVRELMIFGEKILELQSPLDSEDGEGELLDKIADDTQDQFKHLMMQRQMIAEIFHELDDREKRIIGWLYGIEPEDLDSDNIDLPIRKRYTCEEIGKKLGISKQAVSQAAHKALEKAKNRKG